MNLKSEVKKSTNLDLESNDKIWNKFNKNSNTFTSARGGELIYEPIKEGLCISCTNKGNCQWQENYKIYCEHYL